MFQSKRLVGKVCVFADMFFPWICLRWLHFFYNDTLPLDVSNNQRRQSQRFKHIRHPVTMIPRSRHQRFPRKIAEVDTMKVSSKLRGNLSNFLEVDDTIDHEFMKRGSLKVNRIHRKFRDWSKPSLFKFKFGQCLDKH